MIRLRNKCLKEDCYQKVSQPWHLLCDNCYYKFSKGNFKDKEMKAIVALEDARSDAKVGKLLQKDVN